MDRILRVLRGGLRITLALMLAAAVAGKLSAAEAAASPGPELTGPAQALEHPPAADNPAADRWWKCRLRRRRAWRRDEDPPKTADSRRRPIRGLAAGNRGEGRGPFGAVGASRPAGRSADAARL